PGRNVILKPVMGPRSVLLLEDGEHLRRRKLMLPPFHGERMRAYEAVMEAVTEREVATWPADRAFRIHPRMQAITLEVILRAVFGIEDDARRERLRSNLTAILGSTQSPAAIGMTMPGARRRCGFVRWSRSPAASFVRPRSSTATSWTRARWSWPASTSLTLVPTSSRNPASSAQSASSTAGRRPSAGSPSGVARAAV